MPLVGSQPQLSPSRCRQPRTIHDKAHSLREFAHYPMCETLCETHQAVFEASPPWPVDKRRVAWFAPWWLRTSVRTCCRYAPKYVPTVRTELRTPWAQFAQLLRILEVLAGAERLHDGWTFTQVQCYLREAAWIKGVTNGVRISRLSVRPAC